VKTQTVWINPDGSVHMVANDDFPLEAVGIAEKRRASHVVPAHPVKRLAFRVIRFVVGERGRIAAWCRSWYGPWQVRFADNPHVVVFTAQSRRVCIQWEIKQLNERLANET
jgi:hypothetical protein